MCSNKFIKKLTNGEYNKIVYNDTYAPYPKDKTIRQLFEEQKERTPDSVALVFEDQQLTYLELDEKANQLAHTIRREYKEHWGKEVSGDTLIGIYIERSLEMTIGIFGILKSGAAYVLFDSTDPEERLNFKINDCGCRMVLTSSKTINDLLFLAESDTLPLNIDGYRDEIAKAPKHKYNDLYSTDKYDFNEISYQELMRERIINVLLVCSNYDAFMLEEDGRINEKIFLEYTSYNLRYPPRFTHASSSKKAFKLLKETKFDLVITMLNVGEVDAFKTAKKVKTKYPDIPIVVLAHFSREVSIKLANEDLSSIDYVFCWLGNTSLLLAIIKLLEDKMNAYSDVVQKGAQAILLVEDSVRYYSSYLPIIYKAIFVQSIKLMTEGLNEHQKTMRMRARPKILLAKTFEDAVRLYKKYKNNLLGVISDVSYPSRGKIDKEAGIKLTRLIRGDKMQMPILLQSSDSWDNDLIKKLNVSFINKYSKTLLVELKNYIKENYGFGDFVFRNPDTGEEIDRADNLHSMQIKISEIDKKSLMFHVSNNHLSRWFKARALFSIAKLFAHKSTEDFNNIEEIRSYLMDTITNYRKTHGRGIIASHIDEYAIFTRLGDGQLGGKARGLAFIDSFINKHKLMFKWDNMIVTIPRTIVLTTYLFTEFMEDNNLYKFALSDVEDEQIIERFNNAIPSVGMKNYIEKICKSIKLPLAVRSSSLLEDSHYQPFAGVYSTFMLPNNHTDVTVRHSQLEQAIKSVYASVFLKESKA